MSVSRLKPWDEEIRSSHGESKIHGLWAEFSGLEWGNSGTRREMSWCEWWWVLKVCCSRKVVEEISKVDWMELKGIFLRVRCAIMFELLERERRQHGSRAQKLMCVYSS